MSVDLIYKWQQNDYIFVLKQISLTSPVSICYIKYNYSCLKGIAALWVDLHKDYKRILVSPNQWTNANPAF